MNNIAIARRLRGITAKALADQLGVAYQQIGNWEQGLRNPSRSAAQHLAEALDVDVAWILDCPQSATLNDPLSGETLIGKIMRSELIDNYGAMYHLYLDDTGDIVALLHSGGITFTPFDWQGAQPQDASEIAETRWMDWRGGEAIMMDGLPRTIA